MSIYKVRCFDLNHSEIQMVYVASPIKRNRTKEEIQSVLAPRVLLSMRSASEKECAEINSMFY